MTARYLAPPVAVAGVAAGTLAGLAAAAGAPRWLALGWAAPVGYAGLVVVGSVVEGSGLSPAARAWLPAVLATMHGSWGVGFLTSPRRLTGS